MISFLATTTAPSLSLFQPLLSFELDLEEVSEHACLLHNTTLMSSITEQVYILIAGFILSINCWKNR